FPDMQIDWLAEESFADIPRLHPAVDTVIPMALRRWRKAIFNRQTWAEILECNRLLGGQQYDLVRDPQGLLKRAVFSYLAKAPRHGQDSKSAREPLAAYFYQRRHNIPRDQHAVVRNRQLAAKALGYAMP